MDTTRHIGKQHGGGVEAGAVMYPVLLDLADRAVLVVGGGSVAERRVQGLLEAGASVTLVAPNVAPGLAELARLRRIAWVARAFEPADAAGNALVLTATGIGAVDGAVAEAARSRGIFVNAADHVPGCDFHVPAVARRGDIVVAVGTGGGAPALAARIRDRIAASLGPEWERLAGLLRRMREIARDVVPDRGARQRALANAARDEELLAAVARGETPDAAEALRSFAVRDADAVPASMKPQAVAGATQPFVALVGAGPGAPDLLTVRAYERIRAADVVVYDDLVDRRVLEQAPASAERIYAGRRGWRDCPTRPGPDLLVQRALECGGKRVVRLKGGDPGVFGRMSEEIEALEAAGIDYEIVPGVTAALAAAAAARIPLTRRGVAGSLTLATGIVVAGAASDGGAAASSAEEPTAADIAALVRAGGTVVVYMGLRELPGITAALRAEGVPAGLSIAVVGSASTPDETILTGTLDDIAAKVAEVSVPAPAVLIIGDVVAGGRLQGESSPSTCDM